MASQGQNQNRTCIFVFSWYNSHVIIKRKLPPGSEMQRAFVDTSLGLGRRICGCLFLRMGGLYETERILELFYRGREMALGRIGVSDRKLVSDFREWERYDADCFADRRDVSDLSGEGQCGGARSDDHLLSSLRRDLLWIPLLRRNDDVSGNVYAHVPVGADLMGTPSVSEKSGCSSSGRKERGFHFTDPDGYRHLCLLLYSALDENGESDPEHDFRGDELSGGEHDVLQKSVLFACLRGKRHDPDRAVGSGIA